MSYSIFRIGVLSLADYESEAPGYSTAVEDFPFEVGPLALFDTLTNLMKPWGRDPATDLPLYVTEVERYTGTITTNGVNSQGAYATPREGETPDGTIVLCQTTNSDVIYDIEAHAKHLVLGVEDPDMTGEELPPALKPFGWDEPFPEPRWQAVRTAMITLGMPEEVLDNWRDDNPDGTPREFGKAYQNYLEQLIG